MKTLKNILILISLLTFNYKCSHGDEDYTPCNSSATSYSETEKKEFIAKIDNQVAVSSGNFNIEGVEMAVNKQVGSESQVNFFTDDGSEFIVYFLKGSQRSEGLYRTNECGIQNKFDISLIYKEKSATGQITSYGLGKNENNIAIIKKDNLSQLVFRDLAFNAKGNTKVVSGRLIVSKKIVLSDTIAAATIIDVNTWSVGEQIFTQNGPYSYEVLNQGRLKMHFQDVNSEYFGPTYVSIYLAGEPPVAGVYKITATNYGTTTPTISNTAHVFLEYDLNHEVVYFDSMDTTEQVVVTVQGGKVYAEVNNILLTNKNHGSVRFSGKFRQK